MSEETRARSALLDGRPINVMAIAASLGGVRQAVARPESNVPLLDRRRNRPHSTVTPCRRRSSSAALVGTLTFLREDQ